MFIEGVSVWWTGYAGDQAGTLYLDNFLVMNAENSIDSYTRPM